MTEEVLSVRGSDCSPRTTGGPQVYALVGSVLLACVPYCKPPETRPVRMQSVDCRLGILMVKPIPNRRSNVLMLR